MREPGWQLIDSAPKDGSDILGWEPLGGVGIRYWNMDKHARRTPRPFWDSHIGYLTKFDLLQRPPTHWMPLPDPPGAAALRDPGAP